MSEETTTTTTTNIALLEREITTAFHALDNAMVTRRQHPTYGVTKADLNQRLDHIVGMLYAFGVVLDGVAGASRWMQAERIASHLFDTDLAEVRSAVKAA